jgi:hypothetical protein
MRRNGRIGEKDDEKDKELQKERKNERQEGREGRNCVGGKIG